MSEVTDYNGNPLAEGDHVEAWRDGERFTAMVKEFKPRWASDGDLRRIILVRDAVVVIGGSGPRVKP